MKIRQFFFLTLGLMFAMCSNRLERNKSDVNISTLSNDSSFCIGFDTISYFSRTENFGFSFDSIDYPYYFGRMVFPLVVGKDSVGDPRTSTFVKKRLLTTKFRAIRRENSLYISTNLLRSDLEKDSVDFVLRSQYVTDNFRNRRVLGFECTIFEHNNTPLPPTERKFVLLPDTLHYYLFNKKQGLK